MNDQLQKQSKDSKQAKVIYLFAHPKRSSQNFKKLQEIWRKKYTLKRYLELLQKQKTSEAPHKEMLDLE